MLFLCRIGSPEEMAQEVPQAVPQVTVIPGVDSLIGDLLDMDINPPMAQQQFQPSMNQPIGGAGVMDLLGEGLDSLVITNLDVVNFLTFWQINVRSISRHSKSETAFSYTAPKNLGLNSSFPLQPTA